MINDQRTLSTHTLMCTIFFLCTGTRFPKAVASAVATGALQFGANECSSSTDANTADSTAAPQGLNLEGYQKWVKSCPLLHSVLTGLVLRIGQDFSSNGGGSAEKAAASEQQQTESLEGVRVSVI